jgi:PEP-CTERM motif
MQAIYLKEHQIMNKAIIGASLAAAVLATGAHAGELLFSYTETGPGAIDFSFDQSSNPTPLADGLGFNTQVPVSNWTGNIGPYSSIVWFSLSANGMFDTPDGVFVVFGPQVYGGTEAAPTFAPGVFPGADQTTGLNGVLTVTAVPEPAGWALMLIGFGALGSVLRRRRIALAQA